MKDKKIVIQINKSPTDIFTFVLNPANTPLWIDSAVKEEVNEKPTRLGSIYKNRDKEGKWSEYVITAFDPDKMFEMTSRDGNYHVKYTFRPINENLTEMEYYEWVDNDELEEPFTIEILEKLKRVLEG